MSANEGQVYTIRLSRPSSDTPWGFRLAGGQDYQAPVSIQSVSKGSLSERCGLAPADVILRIGATDVADHEHQQVKMEIVRAGNDIEFTVQRGGVTVWRPRTVPVPAAVPMQRQSMQQAPNRQSMQQAPNRQSIQQAPNRQSMQRGSASGMSPSGAGQYNPMDSPRISTVSQTSLAANQPAYRQVGSDFNRTARGFPGFQNTMAPADTIAQNADGRTKRVFHTNYNSPMGLYSDQGVDQAYNSGLARAGIDGAAAPASGNFHSVSAPTAASTAPVQRASQVSMYCGACGDMIKGVFVKIQGSIHMHPECLKCVKCNVGLRNNGYFFIQDKLYCETHARQVAQPPEPGLMPVAVYK